MKIRIISGVTLLAVVATTFIFGGYPLIAFCCLTSVVSFYELTKAMGVIGDKVFNGLSVTGYIGILVYYFILFFKPEWENKDMVFILLIALVLANLAVYVFTFPRYNAGQAVASVFSVIYAPFLFSYIYKIRTDFEMGAYLVFLVLAASSASDAGAYFIGVAIGKHKLAPVLSPKKTIEGAIGGILTAAVIAGVYGYFCAINGVGDMELIWQFAVASAVGSVISQVGDLAASAIKRDYSIKDYGWIIPGHGGAMDRIDSIVVVAPIIYYAFMISIG
ncbi:MAG: phosphatidate cytidylyltransferase [Lachnospiraceae bacterium]|nr:phosphatidate cytidylyltransferase [Lachnospiraceae bacterium]